MMGPDESGESQRPAERRRSIEETFMLLSRPLTALILMGLANVRVV